MSIFLRFPRWGLCFVAIVTGLLGIALAEEFVLQVPGRNDLTSTATVDRQQIVITDSQNQTFIYQRMPQLDTADGRFWGYYSQAAGQTLRWPANDRGSMLIGDPNGRNWRQSQQQIQPFRAPLPRQPNEVTTRRPVFDQWDQLNQPGQFGQFGQRGQRNFNGALAGNRQERYSGPMEVAYASAGDQAIDVGYIGPQGDLQLYHGWRDRWQPRKVATQRLQAGGLLPGAPLRLVSKQGQEIPSAYTVNSGGQLVEIVNGNQIRPVADNLQFSPRSHIYAHSTDQGPEGFAVDAQGRLWNLDLAGGRHRVIDQNAGRFSPGVPISVVAQPLGGRGLQEDLYLVDRTGQILNYSFQGGRWNGPSAVANGFPPGAPLAATMMPVGGRNHIRLAGVDVRGQVQTLGYTAAGWQTLPVRGAVLSPGAPLAFTQVGASWSLSGIGPGGVWNEWDYVSGRWDPSIVTRGFLGGAPLVADPYLQTAFGVDATGRLIAGGYWDNAWHSHLLVPGLDYAPPLVERRILGTQNLAPATVYFDNSSPEELVVQMVDPVRSPGPIQFNIPPGGSVPRQIPRDGGGTLQEVYLVPGPFGEWVERVDSFPVPPQPGPTMVVWSKRVTYSYIDKKGISVLPDFDLKSHVSLGVFDLPPGEFLRDGEHIDVFAEAAYRRNPGAARWFGMPVPDTDIGVPLIRNYEQPQQPLLQSRQRPLEPQQPQPVDPPQRPSPQRTPGTTLPPLPSPPASEDQPRQEERPRNDSEDSQPPQQGPVIPPLPE